MSPLFRYFLAGIKVFIACMLLYLSILEVLAASTVGAVVLYVAAASVSAVYLILGLGQMFGAFLTRTVSGIIRICEWMIIGFLVYRLII